MFRGVVGARATRISSLKCTHLIQEWPLNLTSSSSLKFTPGLQGRQRLPAKLQGGKDNFICPVGETRRDITSLTTSPKSVSARPGTNRSLAHSISSLKLPSVRRDGSASVVRRRPGHRIVHSDKGNAERNALAGSWL
jgi:hypothetical protein